MQVLQRMTRREPAWPNRTSIGSLARAISKTSTPSGAPSAGSLEFAAPWVFQQHAPRPAVEGRDRVAVHRNDVADELAVGAFQRVGDDAAHEKGDLDRGAALDLGGKLKAGFERKGAFVERVRADLSDPHHLRP